MTKMGNGPIAVIPQYMAYIINSRFCFDLKLVLNVKVNFATYDAAVSALKLMAKHFRAYSTLT